MFEPARRALQKLIVLFTSLTMVLAPLGAAHAQGIFGAPRYSAIVVDAASGEVLYAKRADYQRFPASLTKIMTLYMAFEAMATGRLSPKDTIVMSQHGANMQPSKLGLRPGEGVTLDMALQAIAVKSANDMAVAVAERIGGSEERFAQLMTLRAQELGMTNTHFANASGLPNPRNVSSARDLAILSRAVMRDYPQYYGYFGERSISFRGRTDMNHNHLLAKMPGVDGLKTGYIGASGFNLAASAMRNGRRLIAVVLGGSSTATRDENVETLLNAGFEVLARRATGQRITLASIAEPADDNGPIQRPATEEGDGDQEGVRVEVAESLRGPQGLPGNLAGARNSGSIQRVISDGMPDRDCTSRVSYVKKGRGRHAHKVRVVTNPCRGGSSARATTVATKDGDDCLRLRGAKRKACKREEARHETRVAAVDPCAHKHGRAKRTCERTASRNGHSRRDEAENDVKAPAASGSGGGYLIQVGAYKTKTDARAQIAKLSAHVGGEGQVAAGGGGYRARFTGFSSAEAKAACRKLSARGERCMVMSAS
jgi:D-alanyl-D-alanine carboxypeptidase (penicillin-binding protein 5/6)